MKGRASTKGRQGRRRRDAKKQLAVIPEVLDVFVQLPSGEKEELRGVSTDLVADLKLLLKQRTDFCHITNYSFSHPSRGLVPDDLQVQSLRPTELTIVKDNYTPASALRQAQNLLEITTCTHQLGERAKMQEPSSSSAGSSDAIVPVSRNSKGQMIGRKQLAHKGDGNDLKICADIRDFYGPFSLSHCENPVKELSVHGDGGAFPKFDIVLPDDNKVHVVSCEAGFYLEGSSQETSEHELVDLLKGVSEMFAAAWGKLMAEIDSLYPQGNLPFGIASNAWVSPPCMSATPHMPKLLPAEDPSLGAQTLGCAWGQQEGQADRAWTREFEAGRTALRAANQSEALKLQRKMFLAHSSYTDTAIVEAVAAANEAAPKSEQISKTKAGLEITVKADNTLFNSEETAEESSGAARQQEIEEQSQKSVLKGLASHDPAVAATTVDPITVRRLGQLMVAKPVGGMASGASVDVADEPAAARCGDVYLQLNSLRKLLHTEAPPARGGIDEAAILTNGASILSSVLEHCTAVVLDSHYTVPPLRPEIAVSWAQYLKDPPKEGPGAMPSQTAGARSGRSRPGSATPLVVSGGSDKGEAALKEELGAETWKALAKLGVGLHRLSPADLTRKAREWYQLVALPRVAWELCRLEVVPVDGLTLVDFLHTRGINVRHLGSIVRLNKECATKEAANAAAMEEEAAAAYAQKSSQQPGLYPQRPPAKIIPGTMSHVTAVCQMEMISRGMKHLLRAVIAAVLHSGGSGLDVAGAVAATLNAALGGAESVHHDRIWAWIRTFVARCFKHYLPEDIMDSVDQQALMRACCQKTGLEMCARTYDFACAFPVSPVDILAAVPIVKCQSFSLSHPRQLLDNAKTAMDTGNLGDAAIAATEALLYLTNVTGAHNRLTAGAYSLLAVVLYHTGDFLQAAYYQQKALIINERALGLDHPDTLKSYGDLAVFFYRLQHHELALTYVLRCTYMLGLTCGSAHPNTAATYVNIAMMQEGLGNSNAALRYLHAALKCNTTLLGSEHVQTAASYHAMAIALSLMDPPLYSLSVQHEQTCWETLDRQLGAHDIRTIDAVAWLDYFGQKAAEQAAAKNGTGRTGASWHEKSIASKGHLPVKDLMAFLGETGAEAPVAIRGSSKARLIAGASASEDKESEEDSSSSSSGSSSDEDEDNVEETGPAAHPLSSDTCSTSENEEDSSRAPGAGPSSPRDEGSRKDAPVSPVSVLSDSDMALLYNDEFIPRPEPEWMEVKPQRAARARGRKNDDNKPPVANTKTNNRQTGKTAVLAKPADGPKQPQSPRKAPAAPRTSVVPQTKVSAGHQGASEDLGINVAARWPSLPQVPAAVKPQSAPQSAPQPTTTKQEDSKEPEAPPQVAAADVAKVAQGDETTRSKDASAPSPVSAEEKPRGSSSSPQAEGVTSPPEIPAPPREIPSMKSAPPPGIPSDPDNPVSLVLDPTAAAFVPGHGPGGPVPPPPAEAFMPWPVPPPPPHMWMYPPVPMLPHGFPMAPMPPMSHAPMPVTPPPPPPRPMISVAPPPGHEPPPRVSPHDLSPKHAGQQLLQLLQTGGQAGEDNKQLMSPTRDAVAPIIVTPAAGSVRPTHAAA